MDQNSWFNKGFAFVEDNTDVSEVEQINPDGRAFNGNWSPIALAAFVTFIAIVWGITALLS